MLNPVGNHRTETHRWKQKQHKLAAEARAKSLLQHWLSPKGCGSSLCLVGCGPTLSPGWEAW